MRIRLYVDEDAMTRILVKALRARGTDVTTVFEEGMTGLNDTEQLEYAYQLGRVLYSFNLSHFYQLHREYLKNGKNHAGIIVVYRQRYTIGEQIKRLLNVINTISAEEMKNNFEFL